MPPGTSRSRSFTRFTTRVGLPHLGQSVLLLVSITFLRSAVFAILAIASPKRICRSELRNECPVVGIQSGRAQRRLASRGNFPFYMEPSNDRSLHSVYRLGRDDTFKVARASYCSRLIR